MELRDFVIGEEFFTATGKWRCTDVGTRTVAAIMIYPEDIQGSPTWYEGPPYAVLEHVFDENDIRGCESSIAAYEKTHGVKPGEHGVHRVTFAPPQVSGVPMRSLEEEHRDIEKAQRY